MGFVPEFVHAGFAVACAGGFRRVVPAGRRGGWRNYGGCGTRLVPFAYLAGWYSASMGPRAGLVDFVRHDGRGRLAGVAPLRCRATVASMGLAIGSECRLGAGLFWPTQSSTGFGRGCPAAGADCCHNAKFLARAPRCGVAPGSIRGLDFLCSLSQCRVLVVKPGLR